MPNKTKEPTVKAPPETRRRRPSANPENDAKGQYAKSKAAPNKDGSVSAFPKVLAGKRDATQGGGHGRAHDE